MLSRIAESMYWMARYLERAENHARLLKVQKVNSLGLVEDMITNSGWDTILDINGYMNVFTHRFPERTPDNICTFMVSSIDNPNSVLSCIKQARENARAVQERLSSEIWEAFNEFYWDFLDFQRHTINMNDSLQDLFSFVRNYCFRIIGALHVCMPRSEEYDFFRLGLYLERAEQTSRILDVRYHLTVRTPGEQPLVDTHHWINILRSTYAYEAFLKRHQSRFTQDHVIEFLLLDAEFPRSIQYTITMVNQALNHLLQSEDHAKHPLLRTVRKIRLELQYTAVNELLNEGLHNYLLAFQARCFQIGDLINQSFFSQELTDYANNLPFAAQHKVYIRNTSTRIDE